MNTKNVRTIAVCLAMVIFAMWHVISYQERKVEEQKILASKIEYERIVESAKEVFNDISLLGKASFVLDTTNNEIVYQKNAFTPYGIASLTKLMTTDILLRSHNENDSITLSKNAVSALGSSDLLEGEIVSIQTLVDHMLIASSNDASIAASENDPLFISKMNARARSLGMHSFVFESVSGLDKNGAPTATGSAHDVASLLLHIYKTYTGNAQASNVVQKKTVSYQGREIQIVHTNILLSTMPSIVFSKTGYTDLSGGSLALIIKTKEGREMVLVVLGSTFEGRFTDMQSLITKAQEYSQILGGTM